MLRIFQAREYIKPAKRGINRPVRLRGKTADGEEANLFVKTVAGYGNRPSAPGIELFTFLLAEALNIPTPEPVLVEIPAGFERFVFEAPEYYNLIQQSPGTNFGTVDLGEDWKTWAVNMSTRAFSRETVDSILGFDALVQNGDRQSDNPNIMWRDREIRVLDHEKCFGYLSSAANRQHPWREFLQSRPLLRHCLCPPDPQIDDRQFARQFQEDLIGVEGRIPELIATARTAFPASGVALDQILQYFELLFNNRADFIAYFRNALQR